MSEHGGVIVNIIADMFRGFPMMAHTGEFQSSWAEGGQSDLSSQERPEQGWRIWQGLWRLSGRKRGCRWFFALRFLWIKTRRGYPLLLQLSPHHYESFLRWGWIALPLAPPSTPPQRRPTMETPLLLLRLQDQVFLQSGWEPPWRLE